jgi:N-acetylglucosaminyldiphosphoundecaprenol N-acetyl-beta-D-mannosaminyltransferase
MNATSPPGSKIELFGVRIDSLTLDQAVTRVLNWMAGPDTRCRYIVTPNTDHMVLLHHDDALRKAYSEASMVVADGFPLVWASRMLKKALPERVAGSDLVPAIFDAASRHAGAPGGKPLTVFLLGAGPGIAVQAARNIEERWPHVKVIGTHSPPQDFDYKFRRNKEIIDLVADAKPDLLIVGLGAPKQEIWVQSYYHELQSRVAICAGATIDFLAGHRKRAPEWMRHRGLEWLYRLASEPRRLFPRYYRDAMIFPVLLFRELWSARFPRRTRAF